MMGDARYLKLEALDSSISLVKIILKMMELKIIQYSNQFINFKKTANSNHLSSWKSTGLFDKSTKPPTTSINGLAPALNHIDTKSLVNFDETCLIQGKFRFT